MATGQVTSPYSLAHGHVVRQYPISLSNDWVTCCSAPETADNAASTVTDVAAIVRADQNWVMVANAGTRVAFRLKYDDGISAETSPVIQIFGDDSGDQYMKLKDDAGVHELTLTIDLTNDVEDGTWKWTDHVEVDAKGSRRVLCAVKTAFAATGTVDTSVIQARTF